MPSFDIVSKIDSPALYNAIDGVNREINTRYDFKGSESKVEIKDEYIEISTDDELKRIEDIYGGMLVATNIAKGNA